MLAALESRCRIIQASLVAQLMRRKSWEDLGFARLGDYAVERLGLRARTLQDDARVVTAFESLPALQRAFNLRHINWTHARLVTTVATPQSERYWLRQCLCMTTRELEKLVHTVLASMRADGASRDPCMEGMDPYDPGPQCGPDADSAFETEYDDGPTGIDVGPVDDTEEAEVLLREKSGSNDCGDQLACDDVDSSDPGVHSYADVDSTFETIVEVDDYPSDPNAGAAHGCAGLGTPGPNACAADAAAADADPFVPWTIQCTRLGRQIFRAAADLACRMNGAAVPMWKALESMAAEAMSGPAAETLHRSGNGTGRPIRPRATSLSWKERSEAYTAAFQATYGASEGWKTLGPATPAQRLSDRLESLLDDLSVCDGREIDRRLRTIRAATQRLDWQLGTVLRTMADRKLHQELGFATLRLYAQARLGICGSKANALVHLERHCIYKSMDVRDAYRDGSITYLAATELLKIINEKHERAWIERARETTLLRLRADVSYALDRMDDRGGDWSPPPPPLDLNVVADTLGRIDPAEVQMRARDDEPSERWSLRLGARITIQVPASVAEMVEETIEACRREGEPTWRAFERMVAHAFETWMALPQHEHRVYLRDNNRCQVPGCSAMCGMESHHLHFRSRGGGHQHENRVAVCPSHHRAFIHPGGRIRATGEAPAGIFWEMGCAGGREPALRVLGQRYLKK